LKATVKPIFVFFGKNFFPFFFIFFILSNTLLSYSQLSLELKLWLGFIGLIFFLMILLQVVAPPAQKEIPAYQTNLFRVPALAWLLVVFVALFLRFYKIGELSVWPMWDEGHYAYFAIDLAEKWHWQLFFSSAQYMPVYVWLEGLFFKVLGPSLFSMWLYPLLYSLILLPLAYAAARMVFSDSYAFLYFLLVSLSFWPLYVPNFSNDIGLCLIWEHIVFILWICFQRALKRPGRCVIAAVTRRPPFDAPTMPILSGVATPRRSISIATASKSSKAR